MNKVSQESIKSLLEQEDSATLSMYMPTHRFPSSEHIDEDKIRFKNLVRAGKKMLSERGVDDGIVEQIAAELDTSIYENVAFWQQSAEGLAVFCSPAGVQYFHLPIECDEHVSAGDRYDVTPLLALESYNQSYYLLALATHNPVLYKGDMYGIERVGIELPESPEIALNIDESHANSKTDRASGYPGSKAHGQGDSKQAGQEERLKFFRIVDDKIHSTVDSDSSVPLLLAGTDDEVSGYREVSKSRYLLESTLNGNQTESAPHEIHAKSWPLIVDEVCDKERDSEIEKLNSLIGTGKASAGAEDITAAAKEGRVDTLFVGMLTTTRDTVSDSDEPIVKMIFPENYLSSAATTGRAVFDQGGKIVAVTQDTMPDGANQAALYRY